MVAQEDGPLGVFGYRWRLLEDVDDREAVLALEGQIQSRHQREVERHVAFVPVSEVLDSVLWPLVRLRDQHPVLVVVVEEGTQPLQLFVRLWQILAVGALTLEEVRDGIEPQTIHTEIQPESQHIGDCLAHVGLS